MGRLTPPTGNPLPPIPPLVVELAAAPLTVELLVIGEKEVTRPGRDCDTVLVIVSTAWDEDVDEEEELEVVEVDVLLGVVDVLLDVEVDVEVLVLDEVEVELGSSDSVSEGEGDGDAVVGAGEEVVGGGLDEVAEALSAGGSFTLTIQNRVTYSAVGMGWDFVWLGPLESKGSLLAPPTRQA